ncbi:MAG: hypothetical protein ABIY55_12580 [Kofleriaceae bacterium]
MANTKLVALVLVMGCSKASAPQPVTPGDATAQGEHAPKVVAAEHAEPAESAAPGVAPAPAVAAKATRNQPPHIKLKLGHYSNAQLGIGVTIDLTEMTENVADIDPAKVRFDGETKVRRLQGENGPRGRIDYLDGKHVVLQVWDDGRRAVFVRDPDTDKSSEEIYVRRDGDADPL